MAITTNGDAKKSKIPYIIASIAVACTFLNWIEAYTSASVGTYSSNYGMSFSAWTGGYGASALIIFLIGCILYYRNNSYYWVAGIIAIADGIYIYYALTQANFATSYDVGSLGGSASAGYNILLGFYLFIGVSALYSLTVLLKPIPKSTLYLFSIIALGGLTLGCETGSEQNSDYSTAKHETSQSINGTYEGNTGGVISSITIMDNSWFGTHTHEFTGQIIESGSGIVEKNKVYDKYGREMGHIKNGNAYIILGDTEVILNKSEW